MLLLTGYLGSGKTTLLNRILGNRKGIRFAVIVNDIGEVNIDASLVQKGGVVGSKGGDDLVALQNGCICCTLKMDLVEQLRDLAASGKFDYVVIEASGICEPEPIAATIDSIRRMDDPYLKGVDICLDCIVTVVDALRLKDEFGCGRALTGKFGEEDIENLIIQQIEFCNLILLNKVSEVTKEDAAEIKAVIKALQPKAEIIECDYADVEFDRLLDTHLYDFEKTATSAAWIKGIESHPEEDEDHGHHDDHAHNHHGHHEDHDEDCHHEHGHNHCHHHHHHHDEGEAEEYGIGTFVYYRRAPFDIHEFDKLVATQWPSSVIRTKGIMYFAHNTDMSYLFEQAGSQKKLSEAGLWYATAPEEDLIKIMKQEPGLMRDWDEKYGDRMIKLVFIGRNMDRKAIEGALDSCLSE